MKRFLVSLFLVLLASCLMANEPFRPADQFGVKGLAYTDPVTNDLIPVLATTTPRYRFPVDTGIGTSSSTPMIASITGDMNVYIRGDDTNIATYTRDVWAELYGLNNKISTESVNAATTSINVRISGIGDSVTGASLPCDVSGSLVGIIGPVDTIGTSSVTVIGDIRSYDATASSKLDNLIAAPSPLAASGTHLNPLFIELASSSIEVTGDFTTGTPLSASGTFANPVFVELSSPSIAVTGNFSTGTPLSASGTYTNPVFVELSSASIAVTGDFTSATPLSASGTYANPVYVQVATNSLNNALVNVATEGIVIASGSSINVANALQVLGTQSTVITGDISAIHEVLITATANTASTVANLAERKYVLIQNIGTETLTVTLASTTCVAGRGIQLPQNASLERHLSDTISIMFISPTQVASVSVYQAK